MTAPSIVRTLSNCLLSLQVRLYVKVGQLALTTDYWNQASFKQNIILPISLPLI